MHSSDLVPRSNKYPATPGAHWPGSTTRFRIVAQILPRWRTDATATQSRPC